MTLSGELLAADGSLSIGPRQGAGSLISRRSELRVLRRLIAEIESTIGQVTVSLSQLEQQMASDEQTTGRIGGPAPGGRRSAGCGAAAASEAQLRLEQCEERQSCCRPKVLLRPTNGRKPSGNRSKPAGGTARQAHGWQPWKARSPRPTAKLPNYWQFSTSWNAASRQPRSNWPKARSGWKTLLPAMPNRSAISRSGNGQSKRAVIC